MTMVKLNKNATNSAFLTIKTYAQVARRVCSNCTHDTPCAWFCSLDTFLCHLLLKKKKFSNLNFLLMTRWANNTEFTIRLLHFFSCLWVFMHLNMNLVTTLVVFAFSSVMESQEHIKLSLQKKNFPTKVLIGPSKIGNIGHHFLQFGCFWNIFVSQLSSVFSFLFYCYYYCFYLKIFLLQHDSRTPNFLPKEIFPTYKASLKGI